MSVICPDTAAAWARLMRVQQALLGRVEAELKAAGFPPLAWYDVLLELSRADAGKLRPLELEKRMLLPQYGMSRLVDRMVKAGYVTREACPVDGRGQMIAITAAGRALQKRMWPTYADAIRKHVGAKLAGDDAHHLNALLTKLMPVCPTALPAERRTSRSVKR
jgi:DNA-binding MarR family transcriptional regulator